MNPHESIADKLRRLRREAPLPSPEPERLASRTGHTASLPPHVVRRLARAPAASPLSERATSGPPRDLAPGGGAWQRVTHLPGDHVHGVHALDDALDACRATLALIGADAELARLDPARAVYLDIEATGLSGGSGTYPYLVALARRTARGWELWQGFMAAPSEEPALLTEVARRVAAAGAMVTFFGKSYDRHRLEDKMRHHRIAPPFDDVAHLDLYHPLRRLYDGAEPDGKLQTHERVLCGFERDHDLGGAYAPMAWFDFVADRPHLLEDVFRHNASDVLSLIGLTAHVGRVRDEPSGLAGSAAHRARGVARALARAKRHAEAATWFERAAERFAERGEPHDALAFDGARELERAGDVDAAYARYEVLARDAAPAVSALAVSAPVIAAPAVSAMACERAGLIARRRGEVDVARDWARRGLDALELARPSTERERLRARLERRR